MPQPPDRRGKKVLVIAPGFGFRVNNGGPGELAMAVMRSGFEVKVSAQHRNPEGFAQVEMAEAIETILAEVDAFEPDAVLCASKGGAYMAELWRRMDEGNLGKVSSPGRSVCMAF